MHSALEVPNRLVHHVLEEASFLILLTVLDAAVAANMLALAQILALFLGIDTALQRMLVLCFRQ